LTADRRLSALTRKASLFVELSANIRVSRKAARNQLPFGSQATVTRRHHATMADTPSTPPPGTTPLRLRRVLYQTGATDWGEGIVTEHDQDSGMVTVLDTEDGSFWRGPECQLEILA
jgi:hypothetical protein